MLKSKELKLAILFLFIVIAPYLFTKIAIQGSGNLDVNKILVGRRAPFRLSPKDESKFIEDPYKYPVMSMGLSYSYIFFGLITYFFFWWYIEIKNLNKQKFDRYFLIPITIIFLIYLMIYEII